MDPFVGPAWIQPCDDWEAEKASSAFSAYNERACDIRRDGGEEENWPFTVISTGWQRDHKVLISTSHGEEIVAGLTKSSACTEQIPTAIGSGLL